MPLFEADGGWLFMIIPRLGVITKSIILLERSIFSSDALHALVIVGLHNLIFA
jgi:hypothetical protein